MPSDNDAYDNDERSDDDDTTLMAEDEDGLGDDNEDNNDDAIELVSPGRMSAMEFQEITTEQVREAT